MCKYTYCISLSAKKSEKGPDVISRSPDLSGGDDPCLQLLRVLFFYTSIFTYLSPILYAKMNETKP